LFVGAFACHLLNLIADVVLKYFCGYCNFVFNFKNKEKRYSRVPRLSDTRYSAKKDQREMEICKQQSEIKKRQLPAVDRFKRYGR